MNGSILLKYINERLWTRNKVAKRTANIIDLPKLKEFVNTVEHSDDDADSEDGSEPEHESESEDD